MAKEGEVSTGAEQCPRKPPLGRTNNRKKRKGGKDGVGMCIKEPHTEKLRILGFWAWAWA